MYSGQISIKILLGILFSVIIIAEADYNCPEGVLTPRQREEIVRQHNELRSKLIHGKLKNKDGKFMPKGKNMLKMTWSCALEYSAQRWADNREAKRRGGREVFRYEIKGIGENVQIYELDEGFEGNIFTVAGEDWWSELETEYTDNPTNRFTLDISYKALRFTQMAWAKTHEIGCAAFTSKPKTTTRLYVICQYSPSGNQLGQMIYEHGKPCKKNSDCSTKKCSKKTGLCK